MLPSTPAEQSTLRRTALLKLDEEGGLTGSVTMNYSGHFAVGEKRRMENQSEGSREEEFKKRLEARYPGAKITNLKIVNANSPLAPLSVTYDIAMESYGQRTGKRLFFQPTFFNYGDKPVFSSGSRRYPIVYRHPYVEEDEVRIEYPESMALDNADLPGKYDMGGAGSYVLSGVGSNTTPVLKVNRKLIWGAKGTIFFEPKVYPALKQAWDAMHGFNTHLLTLKVK